MIGLKRKENAVQVSYENLMDWVYTICEKIGGTANIRLVKDVGETYKMVLDLAEGTDRSLLQEENLHIIFSDAYSNLLSFSYASDTAITRNFAYIYYMKSMHLLFSAAMLRIPAMLTVCMLSVTENRSHILNW